MTVSSTLSTLTASCTPAALSCQARRLLPAALVLYVPTFMALAGLFLYWYFTGHGVDRLTRDPLSVVETELLKIQQHPEAGIHALAELRIPVYAGALSSLGTLFWSAAATLCFFTAWQSRGCSKPQYSPGLFWISGLITTMLLLDDLFLFHERVMGVYLGIHEIYLIAVYAVLLGYLFLRYHADIFRSDFLLLVAALAAFGVSLLVDQLPETLPQTNFFEDGAKFAGIVSWTGYYWRLGTEQLGQQAPQHLQRQE